MTGTGVLAVAGSIFVVSLPAFAAGEGAKEGAVTAALTATKIVVGADGREVCQPSQTAVPGDVLEYSARQGRLVLPHTMFTSVACGTVGTGLAGCNVVQAPSVGAAGALRWDFAGSLTLGGGGTVTFSVKIE